MILGLAAREDKLQILGVSNVQVALTMFWNGTLHASGATTNKSGFLGGKVFFSSRCAKWCRGTQIHTLVDREIGRVRFEQEV
ncbi:MAG: hypothetical protein AAF641_03750 [Pseudomonadota bacterium]